MEINERIVNLMGILNDKYLEILNDVVGLPVCVKLVEHVEEMISNCNSRMTRTGWGDFCWESKIVEMDKKIRLMVDLILRELDWMTTVWIDFDSETAQIEIKNAD